MNQFDRLSQIDIVASMSAGKTQIKEQYFTPPFKIMRPFHDDFGRATLMILSSSAGLMSGDRQKMDVKVTPFAHLTVTSQSYEKIHRMEQDFAFREVSISVEENAYLNWTQLPVIPFAGSDFRCVTDINISQSSKFLLSEVISCGRVASGEKFLFKRYKNTTSIKRDGALIYKDNVDFIPSEMDLSGFTMFESYTHILNFTAFGFDYDSVKQKLLNLIEEHGFDGGVTKTYSGDVAVRVFGESADKLYSFSESLSTCFDS